MFKKLNFQIIVFLLVLQVFINSDPSFSMLLSDDVFEDFSYEHADDQNISNFYLDFENKS